MTKYIMGIFNHDVTILFLTEGETTILQFVLSLIFYNLWGCNLWGLSIDFFFFFYHREARSVMSCKFKPYFWKI